MSEKKVCSHCHQSYAKLFEVEIGGEYKAFCCKGCEGVYRFLHEGGYGDFYELLGDKTLKPPKEKKENLSYFDSDGFKQSFLFKIFALLQIIFMYLHLYFFVGKDVAFHEWRTKIKYILNHPSIDDLRDADEFDEEVDIK